jgi:hypothetical protein
MSMIHRLKLSYLGSRVDRMPRGNPSPKLAITVDPEVHELLIAAAEEDGVSVSAWVTESLRHTLRIRAGLAVVAEWEREHGAFTDDEMEAARRRVDDALRRSGGPRS